MNPDNADAVDTQEVYFSLFCACRQSNGKLRDKLIKFTGKQEDKQYVHGNKFDQELPFDSSSDKTAALSHSNGSLKSKSHSLNSWTPIRWRMRLAAAQSSERATRIERSLPKLKPRVLHKLIPSRCATKTKVMSVTLSVKLSLLSFQLLF